MRCRSSSLELALFIHHCIEEPFGLQSWRDAQHSFQHNNKGCLCPFVAGCNSLQFREARIQPRAAVLVPHGLVRGRFRTQCEVDWHLPAWVVSYGMGCVFRCVRPSSSHAPPSPSSSSFFLFHVPRSPIRLLAQQLPAIRLAGG